MKKIFLFLAGLFFLILILGCQKEDSSKQITIKKPVSEEKILEKKPPEIKAIPPIFSSENKTPKEKKENGNLTLPRENKTSKENKSKEINKISSGGGSGSSGSPLPQSQEGNQSLGNQTDNQTNNQTSNNQTNNQPNNQTSNTSSNLTNQIKSFAYQLQNADFEEIKNSPFDLIVIDPDDSNFSQEQINELKLNKIVLAYLSIGEAENWRSYWKGEWDTHPPEWMGEENPDWKNNFKVQYWNAEWKGIVFERIEGIILTGYHGLYLDVVDAYDYWEKKGYSNSRREMVEFVKEIKNKAKNQNPKALLFPQNALELLEIEEYLDLIDGVGAENTFYYNNKVPTWSKWDLEYLDKAVAAGKIVLTIDYSTEKDLQCDFIKRSKERGFLPYSTTLLLDRIVYSDCPD